MVTFTEEMLNGKLHFFAHFWRVILSSGNIEKVINLRENVYASVLMSVTYRGTLEDFLNCIAFCRIEKSSVNFFLYSQHDCRAAIAEVEWV